MNALKAKQGDSIIGINDGTNDINEDIERVVLNHLMSNKEITLDQLSVLTSKSRRTIIRITNRLQKEGRLRRIGSTRGGYWEIIS